jgi:hypothetical protein
VAQARNAYINAMLDSNARLCDVSFAELSLGQSYRVAPDIIFGKTPKSLGPSAA